MTLLAFLDPQTGCVLSQTPVHESTNESKAALAFLKQLVLKGKLVVGDAAFCQRDICEKILEEEGDYLLVVKDNQPNLHKAAQQAFVIPKAPGKRNSAPPTECGWRWRPAPPSRPPRKAAGAWKSAR